jgi:hypothetical protein
MDIDERAIVDLLEHGAEPIYTTTQALEMGRLLGS